MTKLSIDAIVFDFDGVLVESVDVKGDSFVRLYESESAEIRDQILAYHMAHGGVSRFDKIRHFETVLLGRTITEERVDDMANRFSQIVEDCVVQASWVAGAQEFLEEHYKDRPLYVASATPQEELRRIVEKRNMDQYFRDVFGSPRHKADHLRDIIRDAGYAPDRVLMVGDAITDYNAAQSAGTRFLGRIVKGRDTPFPPATAVMHDLTELQGLLDL